MATRDVSAYVFSPRSTRRQKAAAAKGHRRKNQRPNIRKTDRKIGECYTPVTYAQAIRRLCDKVGVEPWSPNQLRHTAATRIRREAGLEATQAVLGHARANTTEIYARRMLDLAIKTARTA